MPMPILNRGSVAPTLGYALPAVQTTCGSSKTQQTTDMAGDGCRPLPMPLVVEEAPMAHQPIRQATVFLTA
jgi:hypothetical protein